MKKYIAGSGFVSVKEIFSYHSFPQFLNLNSSFGLTFVRQSTYALAVNNQEVCAVILAGGQSRRMGFNKALIDVDGRPIISILIDQLRLLTNQILISSNDPCIYRFLNLPIVPDRFTGCGPLAGFHAAMHWQVSSFYIVLACDLPKLKAPLLANLLMLAQNFDAAIPRTNDGIAHPLCAVYRRTCLPSIEEALRKGTNRVIEIFLKDKLAIRWVSPEEGLYEDTDLANLNTPEDLNRLNDGHALTWH